MLCFQPSINLEILMKKYLKRIWKKLSAPKVEKLLIVLLPVVTLVLILSILAPTLILFSRSPSVPEDTSPSELIQAAVSPVSPADFSELSSLDESAPSPAPTPVPTPAPTPPVEISDAVSVLDERGRQVYSYSFDLGPNGCLLYRNSGIESDVYPNDVDEDGIPDYGLRWIEDPPAGDGSEPSGHYLTVELFNADNSPNSAYSISAVPVMHSVTVSPGWQTILGQRYYYGADGQRYTGLRQIEGKLYYFNEFGVCADSLGVDVSFYNDNINWAAVKAAGIDFAIVRVGGRGWESGSLYDDACFLQNIAGATMAGLKVGVYFYSTAIDPIEAAAEASFIVSRLNGAKLSMPVYFDTEQSGDYPYGRADLLHKSVRSEIIDAFCETIMDAGYRAGVYSGQNFFKYNIAYHSVRKYETWLASYTRSNRLPNFRESYDMWQFTDRGVVPGIPGVVDMNAIFR